MSLPLHAGSEGGPAATPANGPPGAPAVIEKPPTGPAGPPTHIERDLYEDSYLHSNPYPNTAAPGQTRECEAGTEGYSGASGRDKIVIGKSRQCDVVLPAEAARLAATSDHSRPW